MLSLSGGILKNMRRDLDQKMLELKGISHPKITIVSLFTHSYVISKPFNFWTSKDVVTVYGFVTP